MQFCARLPDHLCARNGWPKFLLREAMAGRLPDGVRWGREKPHIGYVYNEIFVKREISLGQLTLQTLLETTRPFLDPAAVRRAFDASGPAEGYAALHRAYVLSLWLRKWASRPVVNPTGFG